MASRYRDLKVWERAMELVEVVYAVTKQFPDEERFGLIAQMRRAAVSIPSNIAEGRGRGGDIEFLRFLDIAYGSLMELETQVELSKRLGFVSQVHTQKLLDHMAELGRMINGLRTSLSKNTNTRRPKADA